jgi:hypothetical protein
MFSPRGYVSVRGKNPFGNEEIEVFLSKEKVDNLERYGPEWKFKAAFSIPDLLQNPCVIFKGLKRENFEEAYCYSGVPTLWLQQIDPKIEIPFPPGRIFAVYVGKNPDQRLVILDWEKRKEDPQHRGYPENWKTDFGEPIWQPD